MCDRCMELEQRVKEAEYMLKQDDKYFGDLLKALERR